MILLSFLKKEMKKTFATKVKGNLKSNSLQIKQILFTTSIDKQKLFVYSYLCAAPPSSHLLIRTIVGRLCGLAMSFCLFVVGLLDALLGIDEGSKRNTFLYITFDKASDALFPEQGKAVLGAALPWLNKQSWHI